MTLFEAVIESSKPLVILTDHETKHRLLIQLSEAKVFKPMLFLSEKDLYEKVFFGYDSKTVFKASADLTLKPKIVRKLIKNLYFIDPNTEYETAWLNQLAKLKEYLEKEGYIHKYPYLEFFFQDKLVLSTLESNDLNEKAYEMIKRYTDIKRIDAELVSSEIYYRKFEAIEEEVLQLVLRLKKTENFSETFIVYTHEDYSAVIERLFNQFNIPFNHLRTSKLLSYQPVQQFLKCYLDSTTSDIHAKLDEALEVLRHQDLPLMRRLYTKTLQIINQLIPYIDDTKLFYEMLKDAFEVTQLSTERIKNAIEVGSLTDLKHRKIKNLHLLGAAESLFPSSEKPYDTLNDRERECLGLSSVSERFKKKKSEILLELRQIEKIFISYAETGLTEQFYRAYFLDEIENIIAFKELQIETVEVQKYSKRYDQTHAKKLLDNYYLTNQVTKELSTYYSWFKEDLEIFNPQFKGIEKASLNQLIPKELSLSYTKLTTFYKCQFRFLLEHLLKIEEPFDTLAIDLGRFFHEVLETHLELDELNNDVLVKTLENVIDFEKRNYTERERFFFENSFETLKFVFKEIKAQEVLSDYSLMSKELKIERFYEIKDRKVRFSGIIDKLLARQEEDLIHVLMFDYKTGKPTLKLPHSYYGFDSQLVFYMVLLKTYFKNKAYQVNGFYEQMILPKPPKYKENESKEDRLRDSLKWVGYTVNDSQEIRKVDRSINDGTKLKGIRLKNDGEVYKNAPTYQVDILDPLTEHVEGRIIHAMEKIISGDFSINPKHNQKRQDLSCGYCKFKDICFKRFEDYQVIDVPESVDDLFERFMKEES